MNAVLGTIDYGASSVISAIHPPVIKTMKAKTNNGTLAAGLVVAEDSAGDIVAYNPGGTAPLNEAVGVLVQDCDTTTDDGALVLRHGTVVLGKLKVGTSAPDADDLAALEALGIFAVAGK
uniref:Head decoration protein n=1 Tax=Gracilinema caldarium TaxID=215591 RepID=A0A7C3I633_9SPIR